MYELGDPSKPFNAPPFGSGTEGSKRWTVFIAIDPSAYSPGFHARAESMIEAMSAQDGVRLPGDRRHQHRIFAKRAGVWLDPHNYKN